MAGGLTSLLIAAALLIVTGCGFTPVYATKSNVATGSTDNSVRAALASVDVGLIADRDGQYLRNALLDRLSGTGMTETSPQYFLRISNLRTQEYSFGLRKDASSTRGDIVLTADLQLIDMKDQNSVVLRRHLHARGGYDRTDNLYGALVAKEALTERLLNEMADHAVSELGLFFARPRT